MSNLVGQQLTYFSVVSILPNKDPREDHNVGLLLCGTNERVTLVLAARKFYMCGQPCDNSFNKDKPLFLDLALNLVKVT